MKLTIRKLRSTDIGALREMSVDFMNEVERQLEYPQMDESEVDKHMLEVLSNISNPDAMYLIAYDGKKPAGFYIGYVGDKPYSKPQRVAVAQELYVVPQKRSGSVGLRLMEEAGALALSLGAEGFEAIGTFGGTDKRWEKFGFKPHTVYLHMEPEAFMNIVQRFTKGKAA